MLIFLTLPKFNEFAPEAPYRNPIGKDRLPTTIFEGRAVKLRGGNKSQPIWMKHQEKSDMSSVPSSEDLAAPCLAILGMWIAKCAIGSINSCYFHIIGDGGMVINPIVGVYIPIIMDPHDLRGNVHLFHVGSL